MPALLKTFLKHCLLRVFSQRRLSQSVFKVQAFWKLFSRRSTARKLRALHGVRVNIGCGFNPTDGWINLDMISSPKIDYWDCSRGLPFNDGAVAAIFTEHFVEHLEYPDEVGRFLTECCRCLSSTGILRVIVPDAGLYLQLYVNGDLHDMAAIRPLTQTGDSWRDDWLGDCYSTKMQMINAVFRQNGEHKYAYDAETLTALLQNAGFAKISRSGFATSADLSMAPDTAARRTESLYVEASKA